MTTWDEGLAEPHRDIAANPGRILHVLAGPGTGKTFAMMRRIARLLQDGVVPRRVLAVTFTRTAARDLREQLARLDVPGADDVRATTLHSLCFSILSSQEAFAFNQRTPRPLMSFEIDCLENDLAGSFGGKKATRRLLQAYEAAWARLQRDTPGHAPTPLDQAFETALLSWLRFHTAMLIGELVPLTLAFIRANPGLPVLPALEHVLADEFQDLNRADQQLVLALAAAASLLVIGDDNQSIYRFRHANPEGVRSFPADVPGTLTYSITECRRCPPNIVALSNSLISHDPHTTRPQPLTPDPTRPDATLYVVQHATLSDEIASIAEFVDHHLKQHPELPAGRVLILTPRRFIGNAIKDALIRTGRNALSYFQEDALSEDAAAEGFCLLSLLVSPTDRAAFRAWLGFGSPDSRWRPYARLRAYCETNAVPVQDALAALAAGTLRIPYTAPLVTRWNELQVRLASLAPLSGLALVDALWPAGNPDVTDIRSVAAALALTTTANEEVLAELREAITQPELPGSDSDVIQVMSLHKSKGLTRDVVVVAGCMAGTLPSIDADDPPEEQANQLDEQRRLFYVAITRATSVLVISSAIALPLRDALRGGAKVARRTFLNGEPFAITAFTPFLGELGPTVPAPISTAEWRRRSGVP
jgi:DNA helicase II / ATP-dependent DNA helicase PcrA